VNPSTVTPNKYNNPLVINMNTTSMPTTKPTNPRKRRRAFSLIEVLVAIAITASLLVTVMVALDASFRAYRSTTESASRHTIARLTMHRMLALIRTGSEFGPYPVNVITDPIITSDYLEFQSSTGEILRIEYRKNDQAFYVIQDPGGLNETESLLISGAPPQYDENSVRIKPFTLQYEIGPKLYRATVDFLIGSDPDVDIGIEYENAPPLRLVASAIPRNNI